MFARLVTLQINENKAAEFPQIIGREILPLLRAQRGFRDELVLVTPGKTEATVISLWENKETADIYTKETYPQVSKILNKFIVGSPAVKTFDVEYATIPTFQKLVTVPVN